MSIISLSSDLGENNFNIAQLKTAIYRRFPESKLIDLYHQSEAYDIESIAYQVLGAIETFPEESIHVIYGMYSVSKYDILITKIQNQYIIAPNNGLLSLIHFMDYQAPIYSLSYPSEPFTYKTYREQVLNAMDVILQNQLKTLSETISIAHSKPFNTDLAILDNRIITRVIHTNTQGNIILNIRKDEFSQFFKDKPFYILFYTIKIYQLSPNYTTTYNNNRIGALFNETGFLELFMNGDKLSKLFNINKWTNNKFEIFIDHDTNSQINFQART